ncbi:MAG: type II toxin-antitoxin system prevent-host-death family antitoxin [Verrucomicrobiota bacterium]|nr:type II toxin-antitoxin system prevent-host-death family antitoxin [Verrucomicrobiota bacterium]
MDAISYLTVKLHLAETMKKVCDNHDPVIITREKSNPVIMLSLEDYEALNETAYLMQNPRNATRLLQSIEELELGNGSEKELIS